MTTVVVSGGFDPIHPGHLALFRQARALGDRLVVVVESDEWVARKHRVQQPQRDRANLVADLRGVDAVLLNDRADGNCAHLVKSVGATVFAVGLDHRDISVIPEYLELTAAGIPIRVIVTAHQDYRSSRIVAAGGWVNPIPMVAAVLECDAVAQGWLLGVRPGDGGLELPGGFVESGETYEDAVRREVREETGREMRLGRFPYVGSFHGRYPDGREIVVAAFRGYIDRAPDQTPEMPSHRFVGAVPDEPFFHEIDLRILKAVIGGHR